MSFCDLATLSWPQSVLLEIGMNGKGTSLMADLVFAYFSIICQKLGGESGLWISDLIN